MILGISIDEAIKLMGSRKATKACQLRSALRSRGVWVSNYTALTKHHDIPSSAILRLTFKGRRNWHWMLKWEGVIYDPAGSWPKPAEHGAIITSFIRLSRFGDEVTPA